jgi:L-asparaginase
VGAGGTIAMHGAHGFDWVDYFDSGIIHHIDEVIATHPLQLRGIEALPVTYRLLPSTGIGPGDWQELARFIQALAQELGPLDGIVVTHGTATLEETAFFMNLVHDGPPLVLVGAQRPANTIGSDAIPNLRGAVAAAGSGALPPGSVSVLMDGYLYSPTDVTKTGNHQLHAFEAPEFGPLGSVDAQGRVSLRRQAWGDQRLPLSYDTLNATPLPRVDIVFSYAGADDAGIRGLLDAGAQGLVVAGFAPGRCANGQRPVLEEAAARGVKVVQCSRAYRGSVPAQTYNEKVGILGGGRLSPQKARILLMLMLRARLPHHLMQELLLRA